MSKSKFDKAIENARKVNLVEYCKQNGIDLINGNSTNPKMREHDSLVFFPDNIDRQWHRYSTGEGGDSIDFIRFLNEKNGQKFNFKNAIKKLNAYKGTKVTLKNIPVKQEFQYDFKKECVMDDSKKYLINDRKINPKIIKSLIDNNLLAENKYKNVIYKWIDPFKQGRIVGASEEGTGHTRFKKIQKNSETGKGFNILIGEPKKLKFFESPVDLMSYMSLDYEEENRSIDDTWYISMDGLKETVYIETLKTIIDHYKSLSIDPFSKIEQVKFCVDSDEKGQEFAQMMCNRYTILTNEGRKDIEVDSPKHFKDWNDFLKDKRDRDQEIKKEISNEIEL